MYGLELAGEDDAFAAFEAARAAGAGVEIVAPGLATTGSVRTDRVGALAYTHAAVDLIGRTDADLDSAVALLAAARLDRDGTVAVRARNVRGTADVSTADAERKLGSVLVERGFAVDLDDPDHELRALFASGPVDGDHREACLLGWLAAESVRDYGDRRPTDRPFFQPGSMAPLDARALANVAGAAPGRTILDPMCGTGGVLIEAGLAGADAVGVDAQAKMARGARRNLAAYLDGDRESDATDAGDFEVLQGDATSLPLRDGAVDGVVFDAPYGRQSKIARHGLADLVTGALGEARRVAPRAVVVADRPWREAVRETEWRIERLFERPVHRSLTRYVHVLEPESELDGADVRGST